MDKEVRKRFAQFIKAELAKKDILQNLFGTEEPTETSIQNEYNKKHIDSKSKKYVTAKTLQKFLNGGTLEPGENTLNFAADFFGIEPFDVDHFNRLWRDGEITEQDLVSQYREDSSRKRDFNNILPYIETYAEESNQLLSKFVGRQFVYDKIDEFITKKSCGYFFIIGKPGVGKTSLSIKLALDHKYFIHIINADKDGSNSVENFLQNICAQLIVQRKLEFEKLPKNIVKNGKILKRILNTVSINLKKEEKIIIVVDGIDELNNLTIYRKINILFLPQFLPPNIYFILTMRDIEDQIRIPDENNKEIFRLEQNSSENIADVNKYITKEVKHKSIQKYLKKYDLVESDFIKALEEKSEGNFMYLKHVLPEIANGNYKDTKLNQIPKGLYGYYRDHWERMKGEDEKAWFKYKLPIIKVLALVDNAYPTEIIAILSGIKDEGRIGSVLREWKQFLYIKEERDEDGNLHKCYKFYHKSFNDFLKEQDEIPSEHVYLKQTMEAMNDKMFISMFGDDEYKRIFGEKAFKKAFGSEKMED